MVLANLDAFLDVIHFLIEYKSQPESKQETVRLFDEKLNTTNRQFIVPGQNMAIENVSADNDFEQGTQRDKVKTNIMTFSSN